MSHPKAEYQELHIGLVRLHVLHHASIEPIFGMGMIEETWQTRVSPRTGHNLPVVAKLERRGWLKTKVNRVNGRRRVAYSATRNGEAALEEGRERVGELFVEVFPQGNVI